MKVYEVARMNRGVFKHLRTRGITMDDISRIDLYDDYVRMKEEGDKTTYIVNHLAERENVSERTAWKLINKFEQEITV